MLKEIRGRGTPSESSRSGDQTVQSAAAASGVFNVFADFQENRVNDTPVPDMRMNNNQLQDILNNVYNPCSPTEGSPPFLPSSSPVQSTVSSSYNSPEAPPPLPAHPHLLSFHSRPGYAANVTAAPPSTPNRFQDGHPSYAASREAMYTNPLVGFALPPPPPPPPASHQLLLSPPVQQCATDDGSSTPPYPPPLPAAGRLVASLSPVLRNRYGN
jgi:hypothetical protein